MQHIKQRRRNSQRKHVSNVEKKRRRESNENKFLEDRRVENFRKERLANC